MEAVSDQGLLTSLRARFASSTTFPWEAEWPLHAEQSGASVLIALAPTTQGLSVLLTRRTDHLYNHPGQISFPGGRIEADDASPIDAALRETEEEIGLRSAQVEVLGVLPDYATSSGFCVTPVVGLASPDFVPKLDDFEVAELFSVPLHFLLQANNYQRHRVQLKEMIRHFYAVPYLGRFIWGATAGMLAMFAAFMASPHAVDAPPAIARQSAQTDLGASASAETGSGVYSV
ncbi:MAG: CoA pyrophosphatase [Rhodocyclales bacterium]|nr:CoA pyrophosphatase [Rhodocyclales bacterium]